MAVNLTPIEEFNKKLREQNTTLDVNIKSLRTPFRQLVAEISDVNKEFAKIASDNIGQTQDTWKGLITQAKKQRITTQELTDEFENASKQVAASFKKQSEYEEEIYQKKKTEEEVRRQALKKDKDTADGRIGTLNNLEKRKSDLDKEYLIVGKARRAEINSELTSLATNISEREAFLTKKSKDDEKEVTEKREESIRLEVEGRRENEKLVDETNARYEKRLEEAGKTENFDKFTGSIKTLTGGLVDIEGVLDPVAKYVGAFRDLGSVVGSPLAGVKNSFKKFKGMLQSSTEQGIEQSEELKTSNEAVTDMVVKNTKKTTGGFGKLIKNVGLTGIALALLVAGVIALMNRFESFDKLIKGMFGFNDVPDQAKTKFNGLTDEEKTGEEGAELVEQQGERVDALEYKENVLDKASEASAVATGTTKGIGKAITNTPTVTRGFTGAIKEGVELAGDATKLNSAGQRVNDASKYVKDATKTQKVANAAGQVVKTGSAKTVASTLKFVASKAGTPITVLATGLEVNNALAESRDMSAKLEELKESGSITEEQYLQGKAAIEKKSNLFTGEDVVKPIATSTAAIAASAATAAYAAPMLAAGPLGWLGYGLLVAGSGIVAALTVDKVVDNLMTADDDINAILGDESFDSGDAMADLEDMKNQIIEIDPSRKGEEIADATLGASNSTAYQKTVSTIMNSDSSSQTNNVVTQDSPPQNRELPAGVSTQ